MMMTIVQLQPSDTHHTPAWAHMRAALWPEEDAAALRAEAGELLASGQCTVLLALHNDRAIGFIELTLRSHVEGCDSSPAGYIEGWYVAPDHRGQGVGRALVHAAERWCRERGCTHLGSDTEVSNVLSQAAHRALGFSELPPIICFYKSLASPGQTP